MVSLELIRAVGDAIADAVSGGPDGHPVVPVLAVSNLVMV